MLTTFSLISAYYMYKYFINKNYKIASLFLLLSYYFDCLDGNYARTYNMVSLFGDYYDHISDAITGILVVLGIWKSNANIKIKTVCLSILGIFLFLSCIQLGCVQRNYSKKSESPSLDMFCKICPKHYKLSFWRYFGPGTLVLVAFLIIYKFDKVKSFL
jgi:phosphatidylglycerophosphate synthase